MCASRRCSPPCTSNTTRFLRASAASRAVARVRQTVLAREAIASRPRGRGRGRSLPACVPYSHAKCGNAPSTRSVLPLRVRESHLHRVCCRKTHSTSPRVGSECRRRLPAWRLAAANPPASRSRPRVRRGSYRHRQLPHGDSRSVPPASRAAVRIRLRVPAASTGLSRSPQVSTSDKSRFTCSRGSEPPASRCGARISSIACAISATSACFTTRAAPLSVCADATTGQSMSGPCRPFRARIPCVSPSRSSRASTRK